MSIFGVGPILAAIGIAGFGAIMAADWILQIRAPLPSWLDAPRWAAAAALAVAGITLWAVGTRQIARGFPAGRLLTTGAYSLTRNPMYAGFMVFLIPAAALVFNNLLLLLDFPLVYAAFHLLIRREEQYLDKQFGPAFAAYRQRVPRLCPRIAWRRR